jgi:superfamily II DNA or RNA helicase
MCRLPGPPRNRQRKAPRRPAAQLSGVPADEERIASLKRELCDLDARRASIEAELAAMVVGAGAETRRPDAPPSENGARLAARDKIALFRQLFAGRPDVFALRWENRKDGRSGYAPACHNEWVAGVCGKPKIKCSACPNQAFIPFEDEIVERHLRGTIAPRGSAEYAVGVYPLLSDNCCWFLAVDFDGGSWADDARAYLEACRAKNIPGALERSRSGKGGHVWIFFAEPIAAAEARRLGAALMTEAMERRPEIGFESYDRFFPNQDVLPAGGFGNLIALPLARGPRERGNSVFVHDDLEPYADQWVFLAGLERIPAARVFALVREAQQAGRVLGVRMPVDDEEVEQPWLLRPSRRARSQPITAALPKFVEIVLADGVYLARKDLPPALVARLIRTAAFANPEFYRAQAMRRSTYDKPRIVSCAELYSEHLVLPRGCLDDVVALLTENGVRAEIEDRRESGARLDISFLGNLQPAQAEAFDALMDHDFGVLAAGTAFGKTVVAAAAVAKRGRSTLVLVHRKELLAQWIERLKSFLSIDPANIGMIGGRRRAPTRQIDVALLQSLVRKGVVSDEIGGYGHLIVDECHHISASSFELVARRSKARYVLGLSATVTRKDGHHPIVFMQCGPVRYRAQAYTQALQRGFEHRVIERQTAFVLPEELQAPRMPVSAVFAALARDEARNTLIIDDVLAALEAGRNPLVLTERRDHLDLLAASFSGAARNITVLRGGMSARDRRAAEASLRAPEDEERLILATGKYLGEGFDDSRLDALFIAMPFSWKGTLAQYVGRLHRSHTGKRDVVVYDYVDAGVSVLARMAAKRRGGYRALGYRLSGIVPSANARAGERATRTLGDDSLPSQVADRYWIYAERRDPESYPDHGPRGGKWLIFIKTVEIDQWWVLIKAATEAGHLGGSAKVSTAKENPNAKDPKAGVICVYTYDVDDVADCRRVREALRHLGVTWKVPYKTDTDTVVGRYAKGGNRVSRLYE